MSLVKSQIEYNPTVWEPSYYIHFRMIERIQNIFLRYINFRMALQGYASIQIFYYII